VTAPDFTKELLARMNDEASKQLIHTLSDCNESLARELKRSTWFYGTLIAMLICFMFVQQGVIHYINDQAQYTRDARTHYEEHGAAQECVTCAFGFSTMEAE